MVYEMHWEVTVGGESLASDLKPGSPWEGRGERMFHTLLRPGGPLDP